MSRIDNLLGRLERVRAAGPGKWLARCPAHDDRSPSLSIKLTDDDKILIHCFSGCGVVEVVEAIGLSLADLMPDKPSFADKRARPPRLNKIELFDRVVYEAEILTVAIRQLLAGKPLSDPDRARILQADETISSISREVRR